MLVDEFSGVLLQCFYLILPIRMYIKETTLQYVERGVEAPVDQYLESVCEQILVMNPHKYQHSAQPKKAT